MDIAAIAKILKEKTVLVIGAGGLGGYAVEHLARSSVGKIIVMDGDTFSPSNLNRQLYCTNQNIGENKAREAGKRVALISSSQCVAVEEFFSEKNAHIIAQADIVIDCVDNIAARLLLEDCCCKYNKVFVHGAIAGLEGQVAVVKPNDGLLHSLYSAESTPTPQTLSFSPCVVASLQVAEAIRYLVFGEARNGLLLMDFINLGFYKVN